MQTHQATRSRMSARRLAEVFDAVRALLLDLGYERLTFDAVAARARTSKTTLYRQWGNKPGLVMAALTHDDAGGHQPLFGDTSVNSLDEVFARLARTDHLSDGDLRMGLMLLHAASSDPDFASALRREIIAPFVDGLASVLESAADRGEIVRDSALFQRLAYLILAHLAFFPLISGEPDDTGSREELFATIVRPALNFPDRSKS